MKLIRRYIAMALIFTIVLPFSGAAQIANAAIEEIYGEDTLKVQNQFISYTVDKKTGRFGISTIEGAPRRAGDQNACLLFKGEKPETSFTTFRIDGEDYIFGNDYGFLGIKGGIVKAPSNQGGINETVWKLGDLEIIQELTLIADNSNPDVGNVKVSYIVVNNGKTQKSIGSRMLFDTMLGENDGSPLIIPGIEKPVEYEISLEGEQVPLFWQAADSDIGPEVISFGLVSGWGNKAPDKMTAAHWNGIGSTKWDYDVDKTLKFTSVFNKHNKGDSAIALYWEPVTIEPGETRVYETYYGLGIFMSVDGNTFLSTLTGPDRFELNEDNTGYVQDEFELSLALDNSLPISVGLTGLSATVELHGGIKLVGGQLREQSLDVLERDSRALFNWKIKGEFGEMYRIAQATIYLHSESLKEPVVFNKYIILPGSSGKIPDIQYTEITPGKLYYSDTRKSFNINGSGFDMLKESNKWNIKLVKSGQNPVTYAINHKQINLVNDTTIQISLPDIDSIGLYTVKLEHDEFPGCTFTDALELTNDDAYKNRKYGILAVIHESINIDGRDSRYCLNAFESESQLEKYKNKDKILLVIRGDIQEKSKGNFEAYTASETPVELNGILLYDSTKPITITEKDGSVELKGNGNLSVSGSVSFWKWDFKISFDQGTKYTLSPEDNEDPGKIEIVLSGAAGLLKNMLAGFILKFNNAYFYKDDDGYGLIFGGTMTLPLGGAKEEEESKNADKSSDKDAKKDDEDDEDDDDKDDDEDDDDDDDPCKIEADVEMVAIGQKANNKIGLKGIAAEATVGFPKDYFPPPVDIGAEASLKVDTFGDPGEVGMKLDVDLKVIKVKGELKFILKPYPFPDKLYLYLGTELGVDIIPPIPVATLYGVGGGLDNISSIVRQDISAPPLTLILTATAEIGRILKMKDLTLSISWQQVELKGDITIKKFKMIKDATVRLRWYTPFGFHLSARLEVFSFIEGKVMLNIYQDNFLGMASVRLFIPEDVPVVGDFTIAGATLAVDMEKIKGEIEFIGIPFGIMYVYDSKRPEFNIGSLDESMEGMIADRNRSEGIYAKNYYDEKTCEEGRMIFGSNLRLIGSSGWKREYAMNNSKYPLNKTGDECLSYKVSSEYLIPALSENYLASADGNIPLTPMYMPVVVALNENNYNLNVQNKEAALFEIEYEGSKPDVKVTKPDGTEYALIEDAMKGNMRYQNIGAEHSQSGKLEQKLWISVVEPDTGIWKVMSNKPLKTVKLYDVKMGSEFTSITSTKIGNDKVKVDWAGKYMDRARINLFLVEEGSDDTGRLLEENIDATAGGHTIQLPDDVRTGKYAIRAELHRDDFGYSTKTTNTFSVTDLKAPEKPGNFAIAPAGNGLFRASWTEETAGEYPAQGYILAVLNVDGTPVDKIPESYIKRDVKPSLNAAAEALIGGEVTQRDGTTVRLEPGKSYRVSIMSHREDELVEGELIKRQHFSEQVISEAIYLPVPQPPKLKLMLKQGNETVPLNTGEKDIDEYYASENDVVLIVESNEEIDTDILLNDETSFSHSADSRHLYKLALNEGENKIRVMGVNSMGDSTEKVIRVISDTKPPLLLIDSAHIRESSSSTFVDIKGKSEYGCKLIINGDNVTVNKEGIFNCTLIMDDNMSIEIHAEAEDSCGNKSGYRDTIYNDRLKAIQKAIITPDNPIMELGGSLKLSLCAVDADGKHFNVKPELVKWSLMTDTGTVSLDSKANVNALKVGKAYVMAEYRVTDGYAHTHAIPITILERIEKKPDASGSRLSGINAILKSGAAEVLERIAAMEKGKKDIYAGRIEPYKAITINADDMIWLSIPEGALTDTADLKISKLENTDRLMEGFPGMRLLSPIFDISLNKEIKFTPPVPIRIKYNSFPDSAVRKIAVYRLDEQLGRWDYIGGNVDAVNNIVTISLSGFSKYAVIENSNLRLFEDVCEDMWSKDSIYSLAHRKAVDGMEINGAYYFKPYNNITRIEFIKMLMSALGAEKANIDDVILPFADRKDIPDWALKHVNAAFEFGLVNGKPSGNRIRLDAYSSITREEACALLGRTLENSVRPKRIDFSDRDIVAQYALDYLDALAELGVLKGYPDNTFRPQNLITREEAAAIIDRLIK